jgi:predicted nucleic-acid-binding Zn-ribbon protein
MDKEKKCLRCGGSNLVPSELQSTGKVYARPKHAKLKTLLTTGVLIKANICLDCGYVELLVNAAKAKSLMKKS